MQVFKCDICNNEFSIGDTKYQIKQTSIVSDRTYSMTKGQTDFTIMELSLCSKCFKQKEIFQKHTGVK